MVCMERSLMAVLITALRSANGNGKEACWGHLLAFGIVGVVPPLMSPSAQGLDCVGFHFV